MGVYDVISNLRGINSYVMLKLQIKSEFFVYIVYSTNILIIWDWKVHQNDEIQPIADQKQSKQNVAEVNHKYAESSIDLAKSLLER